MYNDINRGKGRHSRENGPAKGGTERYWIPGQARNDKPERTYIVMYNKREKG
jgi:hypothetical protein